MGRRVVGRRVERPLRRRLLWPALTTAVMLAITLSLGIWQVQRLAWKRGLLAEIEASESSPPVMLEASPGSFRRVVATGRFLPVQALYGVELRSVGGKGPVMGAHVLGLLVPPTGQPVVVDRGWAPTGFDERPPAGDVRIEAYLRPPDRPVWFGPTDDPVARRFYTLDPAVIGTSFGLASVAPFTLVVLSHGGGMPEPATTLPRPPNDHLSYAVTWFGLSAVLVIVFGLYVRQVIQQGHGP